VLEQEIREKLMEVVGEKWFLDKPHELVAYSYDATPLYQKLPDAVVPVDRIFYRLYSRYDVP